MKKMLICLFAAVLAVSMVGCKGDVGSGSGEGGGSGYIGSKAPDEAKAVGDIVFTDGSATPYAAGLTLTDNQKSKSIAVIYKVDGDKVYGVGMAHKLGIKWCKDTANGFNYNFVGIQCTLEGSSGEISFSGDTDGSNNFTSIGNELGSDNDTNQEGMYPAFEFAKNYKDDELSRVKGSIYEEDWYLPTISELYDIWKVKATVNAAYDLCQPYQPVNYKFGNYGYYWSSSQRASNSKYAYYMDFGNGPAYYDKNTSADVCCIRVF